MPISNQLKGYVYGCIAAVSYGVNPICAKSLYALGYNSNTVLFYRFFLGTLMLGLLLAVQKRNFAVTRKEACVLGVLGLVFALSSITYFISFHYMSGGVAATLVFAYPVFTALLMAVFFKERLKWPSILAILLTIGGIVLLYKDDSGRPIALAGIVLILISALAYALYIIIVNRSGIVMSGTKLTFYAMFSCLLCVVAYSLLCQSLTGEGAIVLLQQPSEWMVAVALGLVPTVISLVFMAMAIQYIGSTPTAIMGALEPVTAAVLGIVFMGEVLTLRISCGIFLILFSVTLIILDAKLRRALAHTRVVKRGRLIIKKIRWK